MNTAAPDLAEPVLTLHQTPAGYALTFVTTDADGCDLRRERIADFPDLPTASRAYRNAMLAGQLIGAVL